MKSRFVEANVLARNYSREISVLEQEDADMDVVCSIHRAKASSVDLDE